MPVSLRILAGLTAAVAWIALGLQFGLIVQAVSGLGYPYYAAPAVFLMFLTIQINLLVALLMSCTAAGVKWRLEDGGLRSALCAYLVAGSFIFALMLAPYWDHHGTQLAADVALHYVTPGLYAGFWLLAVPKSRLRWRDPFYWLIYPLIYLAAVLLLARWSGFYPYPFIDVPALGIGALALNVLAAAAAILTGGLVVVGIARLFDPPWAESGHA